APEDRRTEPPENRRPAERTDRHARRPGHWRSLSPGGGARGHSCPASTSGCGLASTSFHSTFQDCHGLQPHDASNQVEGRHGVHDARTSLNDAVAWPATWLFAPPSRPSGTSVRRWCSPSSMLISVPLICGLLLSEEPRPAER